MHEWQNQVINQERHRKVVQARRSQTEPANSDLMKIRSFATSRSAVKAKPKETIFGRMISTPRTLSGRQQKEVLLTLFLALYISMSISIEYDMFNPFPIKPCSLHVCSPSLLKTLWEKEKLLIMCNFSFSHSVFYPFGERSAIFIQF